MHTIILNRTHGDGHIQRGSGEVVKAEVQKACNFIFTKRPIVCV